MFFKNFFQIKDPLEKNCLVLDSKEELIRYWAFTKKEVLIEDDLDEIRFIEDVNSRRRRDAEVLSLVAANAPPGTMLDIGTHFGRSAARMAANSPQSTIYTVNIHPDDFDKGGKSTTEQLTLEQIGSYYRQKRLPNIKQVYANTKTWNIPDFIDQLSLVYVDGCHDKEAVYSDTKRVLPRIKEGGFILWHDCSPLYRHHFYWIHDVMRGIGQLVQEKIITGHILNVRNSWIGIYKKER